MSTSTEKKLSERIAMLVAILIPILYVIQYIVKIISTWYTQSITNLSLPMILLSLFLNLLLTIHGIYKNDTTITLAGAIATILSIIILVQYASIATRIIKQGVSDIKGKIVNYTGM